METVISVEHKVQLSDYITTNGCMHASFILRQ